MNKKNTNKKNKEFKKVRLTLSEAKDKELWVKHIMSGIAFLPLFVWFIVSAIRVLLDPISTMQIFFYSPINAIFGILFVIVALYHGNFEIKYLIAESRQDDVKRLAYMTMSDFICIVTGLAAILAILQLHFVSLF